VLRPCFSGGEMLRCWRQVSGSALWNGSAAAPAWRWGFEAMVVVVAGWIWISTELAFVPTAESWRSCRTRTYACTNVRTRADWIQSTASSYLHIHMAPTLYISTQSAVGFT